MTEIASLGTAASLSKVSRPPRGRDGRKAAHSTETVAASNNQLDFANSRVILEPGDAGVIARIVHDDGHTDYAGPLDDATIQALAEVSAE